MYGTMIYYNQNADNHLQPSYLYTGEGSDIPVCNDDQQKYFILQDQLRF